MNTTHLIIVVPCYNEESVLPETIRQLSGVLNRMLENGKISIGKILFVDESVCFTCLGNDFPGFVFTAVVDK